MKTQQKRNEENGKWEKGKYQKHSLLQKMPNKQKKDKISYKQNYKNQEKQNHEEKKVTE